VRLPAIAVLPTAALLLIAGCSAPGDPEPTPGDGPYDPVTAGCTPTAAGPVSDGLELTGADGDSPLVVVDQPLSVTTTQRTVVDEGDGELVLPLDIVQVNVTLFSGVTGERALTTGHGAAGQTLDLLLDEQQTIPGIARTVACSHVGDRVVGVAPPAEAYGSAGNEQAGIGPDEPVVYVVDVLGLSAPPAAAEWDDAPAVDFSGEIPEVALEGDPSPELQLAVLEEGDGPLVRFGSHQVRVDYMGVSWDSGEVFDESFSGEPVAFGTARVVQGFAAALVGQHVGSTVLVTMPPDYGYGPTPSADNPLGGQTLVFVVEILELVP